MPEKRKLNTPLIKCLFMFVVGIVLSMVSAITGIGAQVAAAPTIDFLLGFTEDRTKGTSLAFAFFAACGAVLGVYAARVQLHLEIILLIAFGATLGAILVGKSALNPKLNLLRRVGQTMGIAIAVYIIGEGFRHSIGGPKLLDIDFLRQNAGVGAFVIGVVTGALSSLLQVASGILLVPALLYIAGFTVPQAVGTSAAVIALASILPTLSYSLRQAVDRTVGGWMAIGGLLGGLLGGLFLGSLSDFSPVAMTAFGVVAMFLCAWKIWKMT